MDRKRTFIIGSETRSHDPDAQQGAEGSERRVPHGICSGSEGHAIHKRVERMFMAFFLWLCRLVFQRAADHEYPMPCRSSSVALAVR